MDVKIQVSLAGTSATLLREGVVVASPTLNAGRVTVTVRGTAAILLKF